MDISGVRNSFAVIPPAEPASPALQKDQRDLIQAVHAVNATSMFGDQNELTFYFDRTSHKAVVRIVDKESREVVRQIPAESILRISQEILDR